MKTSLTESVFFLCADKYNFKDANCALNYITERQWNVSLLAFLQ